MKHKMKRKNLMLAVGAALCALNAVAAVNFPIGTHLYKGTLKDWQNKVLTSTSDVTVQAVATNGTILASTKVTNPTTDGYNFLLQVPLSTVSTDSTAAIGDSLNCVLIEDSGTVTTNMTTQPLVVGEADAVSTVSLVFVDMKTYTNDTTKAVVQIPAEYVQEIVSMMPDEGVAGDYDPFADYDNDGASNYDEYLAGTSPFDASDKLAIKDYAAPENAPHPITFEYVGGHVYGVATTLSLSNPEWKTQGVKTSETAAESNQVIPSAKEGDVGEATIYVVPAEGATSQFFKMEAK